MSASELNGSSARIALRELAGLPKSERRAAVAEAFLSEVGAVLDVDPDFIDEEASLPEMGADSLRLINIAMRVQDLVGLAVPPNLLPVEASIGEIIDLLSEALEHEDPVAALADAHRRRVKQAIEADLYLLDGTGAASDRVSARAASDPQSVFLTGATGFLGAYLMLELARATTAQIHCLVRAGSVEEGRARLIENLKRFDLPTSELEGRLIIEPGDLGSANFGLPQARYEELAREIDVVIHNGAAVHLTQPYSQVRAANVDGVRTILHFGGSGRLKPVAFVSTVGLFDTPELETLPAITETDGPTEPGLLPNGYTQSKWAGERLVEMAAQKGVPAATLRVGHVIGHGVSEDLAARLAQASFYSTSVPRIQKPIDYVSPDYVASAIVRIPRRLEAFGGIYHVVNPEPFDQSDLELLLPFVPREITLVSRDVWLAELREAARADVNHPLFVALDALGDPDRPMETSFVEQILNRPRIDCARTLEAVAGAGLESRPARDVLVDVLIGMPQLAEVFAGLDLDKAAEDAKAASAAKAAAG